MTTTDSSTPETTNSLDNEAVEAFLLKNPDFLLKHPSSLAAIEVKHKADGAVSLIEKQVTILREKNSELHERLNSLLETARDNDHLFDLTQRLVLALLECEEFGDIVDALYYSFDKEFDIKFTRLIIFSDNTPPSNAHTEDRKIGESAIAQYLQFGQTVCGGLSQETIRFLFSDQAEHIGSAAIAPLMSGSQLLGVLAIGNKDEDYYKSSTGSLFLGHISEVLARVMRPYLGQDKN